MSNKLEPTTTELEPTDLYFDESKQRIDGKWFIVAGVAVTNSDKFRQLCEGIEKTSRMGGGILFTRNLRDRVPRCICK